MKFVHEFKLIFLLIFFPRNFCSILDNDVEGRIEIQMPRAKPEQAETYLCTPFKLDKTRTHYITGFEPRAKKNMAHHMLLFGCKTPGKRDPLFNCGTMAAKQKGLSTSINPCGLGTAILYAWAQNAPVLHLPKDVAFRVSGPDSGIDWLVLQVHYASIDSIPEDGDTSGVLIHFTNVPRPNSAGVYMTASQGRFPAGQTTKAEAACQLTTDQILHPFAFRVHTHALGKVVSGWKVSPDMRWTLLGKDDPQLPQMFNPVADKSTTLSRGDTIASRCTIHNDRGTDVKVGVTTNDEMCNFYVMYWVEGDRIPSENFCQTMGPPIYYWDGLRFGGGLWNIPDEEASTFDD